VPHGLLFAPGFIARLSRNAYMRTLALMKDLDFVLVLGPNSRPGESMQPRVDEFPLLQAKPRWVRLYGYFPAHGLGICQMPSAVFADRATADRRRRVLWAGTETAAAPPAGGAVSNRYRRNRSMFRFERLLRLSRTKEAGFWCGELALDLHWTRTGHPA